MSTEASLLSAFLVGLLGSTHCIGMCGGIVGALTMGLPAQIRLNRAKLFPYLLAYNSGRIASYALAGLIVGALGAHAAGWFSLDTARFWGRTISGVFMIALGLYLAGWWLGLTWLERAGAKGWRRIEPLGRKLLPVRSPGQALGVGLVWGWLPCGMVYSILAWSLAAGSAANGAALMFAFGLGTLPMLLAIGGAAEWLNELARKKWVRQAAGVLVILFGLYTLFAPMPAKHSGHGAPQQTPATQMPQHEGHAAPVAPMSPVQHANH